MRDQLGTAGRIIGFFVIVGIGLGLAGFFAIDSTGSVSGQSLAQGFLFLAIGGAIYTTGPTLGAIIGLLTGLQGSDRKETAAVSGVSTFVGFYLFAALALIIMAMAISEGGGSDGGGGNVDWVLLLKIGIPTGLVGGLTALLGDQFA